MGFAGPNDADYANVVALNLEWLKLLQRDAAATRGLKVLPDALRERIISLGPFEMESLAATPFLLFSFQETDNAYWSRILDQCAEKDLFTETVSPAVDTLVCAALGFSWQLAQRNPYALRLFSGATVYWSERIAEMQFIELLQLVRSAGCIPQIRCGQQVDLWRKLLHNGTGGHTPCSRAAQITALQTLLTQQALMPRTLWQKAARSTRTPFRRVIKANESTQE